MKYQKVTALLMSLLFVATTACSSAPAATTTASSSIETVAVTGDYAQMSPEDICASLTLEQKAAQMMQPTFYNVDPAQMAITDYGSLLSKFEDWPQPSPEDWMNLITTYQTNALSSDAGIPFLYGNDSLHGVNFARGCTIFPHNINIGAANDIELTKEYGQLVGSDIAHTGMLLNFSPCVAAAQDPRWGRTYESYSSDNAIVQDLAVAYTRGLLSEGIIVCPKHFFGDGYTLFGTGEDPQSMLIDRGDAIMTDEQIEEQLAIYQALIDEGVQFIMLSHSSLDGIKMHENEEYISYLKNEMGFDGVVLSDWDSIMNCSGATYKDNIILGVNAGIDMFMTSYEHDEAMGYIIEGVNEGLISEERINDAVTRIIRAKMNAGLFDDPYLQNLSPSYEFGSDRSHEVARQLAAESFVTLKVGDYMTIEPGMRVFVTGPAADDMGALCGGWTYWWQGGLDEDVGENFAEGNTILEALIEASDSIGFEIVTDEAEINTCDMVVLCVGEYPYAEWYGDTEDLELTGARGLAGNTAAINTARDSGLPTLTLIVAGRNVIINDYIDQWDSCIMLYLPGSEGGNAVADVITGQTEAGGTLPMPYYTSVDQIGTDECWHDVGWSANQDT